MIDKDTAERLLGAKMRMDTAKAEYDALRDFAIQDLKGQRKVVGGVETVKISVGRVNISVAFNDTMEYVNWEQIANRILDMFPAVKKVIGNIMRGSYTNDKGESIPYVKPSPRAVLNLSINKQ